MAHEKPADLDRRKMLRSALAAVAASAFAPGALPKAFAGALEKTPAAPKMTLLQFRQILRERRVASDYTELIKLLAMHPASTIHNLSEQSQKAVRERSAKTTVCLTRDLQSRFVAYMPRVKQDKGEALFARDVYASQSLFAQIDGQYVLVTNAHAAATILPDKAEREKAAQLGREIDVVFLKLDETDIRNLGLSEADAVDLRAEALPTLMGEAIVTDVHTSRQLKTIPSLALGIEESDALNNQRKSKLDESPAHMRFASGRLVMRISSEDLLVEDAHRTFTFASSSGPAYAVINGRTVCAGIMQGTSRVDLTQHAHLIDPDFLALRNAQREAASVLRREIDPRVTCDVMAIVPTRDIVAAYEKERIFNFPRATS